MLECWLAGTLWIGWAVINAARRYGPYKRGGAWRIIPGPLPHENFLPLVDPYSIIDMWIDTEREMVRLTPEQRHWLVAPEDHRNSTQVKRARARRKLRELMDGTWVDKRRRANPRPRKGKEREARLARTTAAAC